jgi:hypothetical protein
MLKRVSRAWLPLLVLAAIALGGFVVFRLHEIFGSGNDITREGSGIANDAKPFNPKRVTYEVFGPSESAATINHLDLSANPQSLKHVAPSGFVRRSYAALFYRPSTADTGMKTIEISDWRASSE